MNNIEIITNHKRKISNHQLRDYLKNLDLKEVKDFIINIDNKLMLSSTIANIIEVYTYINNYNTEFNKNIKLKIKNVNKTGIHTLKITGLYNKIENLIIEST